MGNPIGKNDRQPLALEVKPSALHGRGARLFAALFRVLRSFFGVFGAAPRRRGLCTRIRFPKRECADHGAAIWHFALNRIRSNDCVNGISDDGRYMVAFGSSISWNYKPEETNVSVGFHMQPDRPVIAEINRLFGKLYRRPL